MKFMLILSADASAQDTEPQSEKDRVYNEHRKVVHELEAQGKLVGSGRLRGGGVKIRMIQGKPTAIDGPFSETKESVGGYYLIECASREEAVEWAKKMPHFGDLKYSGIEVREFWD